MAELDFYLFGKKVDPPNNWKETEIELTYEDNKPSAALRTTNFEFVLQNAKDINKYISAGLTGGPGIFEGPPFGIKSCSGQISILDGELLTADADAEYECDRVTLGARETAKIDFFNDTASSFRMSYLASLPANSPGRITSADYVAVPYVISEIPDYHQLFSLSIMAFLMAKEIAELIKDVAMNLADIAGVTNAIAGAAKVLLEVAYIVFLIIYLIKLIIDMLDTLIQPDKYKLGMRVVTMVQKSCDFLGLKLSSSILQTSPYKDLVIIPPKYVAPDASLLTFRKNVSEAIGGVPTAPHTGFYDVTFAQLLSDVGTAFDWEVRVFNGTVYIEKYNNFNKAAPVILPNVRIDKLNFTAPDPHGTNASELPGNTVVEFQLDESDRNTYNEYTGTTAQMTMQPIAVKNKKNLLITGLNQRSIPFALAKRKQKFTKVEKTVIAVFGSALSLIAAFTKIIGGNTNFPAIVNRIGYMLLSNDFVSVPKFLIVDGQNKVHPNNKLWTSAAYLMANFHSRRFAMAGTFTIPFDAGQITFTQPGNQYLRFKNKTIPLCCADFKKLINTNEIKTSDGFVGKMEKVLWNPFKEEAVIDFRVKRTFTNNIKQKFSIDGIPL